MVGVGEMYVQAHRAAYTLLWECSSRPTKSVNIQVGLWTVNALNGNMTAGPLGW